LFRKISHSGGKYRYIISIITPKIAETKFQMNQYEEIQNFQPIIKWILIGLIIVFNLYFIYSLIFEYQDLIQIVSNILPPILFTTILLIIYRTELKVKLSKEGITYRLKPFDLKTHSIDWENVATISIHQYKWYQYLGFGKRRSLTERKVSYIMHTGPLLNVQLKDGKVRQFSIQNTNQMNRFFQEHYSHLFLSQT
jgi:hypothetical protein